MAACFSSSGVFAASVFVLSRLPGLGKSMEKLALPGILVKTIDVKDISKPFQWCEDKFPSLKFAEIAVCDPDILSILYKYMPNLAWAHLTWAGVDGLIQALPPEPPFLVTRHAGKEFCNLMAEYVMCHVLNCERRTKESWKNQETKTWQQSEMFLNYRSLDQITVSILGIGNMGSAVAEFFKSRGTQVYGFSKNKRPENSNSLFDRISNNLNDILPDCDYICNTLPGTPLTSGILSSAVLEKCQKKPVFINVGRGSVISECDLITSLRKKLISGAVLDVFETEPLPASSELWSMPQVSITPHVSAVSRPEDIARNFYESFLSYTEGHDIKNVVQWSEGY